jgi:pilus assembly protein CpaD
MMRSRHRTNGLGRSAFAGVIAALLLAGCSHVDLAEDANVETPATRHPIAVVEDRVELGIAAGSPGLSNLEVVRFARRFQGEAKGPLFITAPAQLERRPRAAVRMREIHDILAREGIPGSRVRVRHAGHDGTITLSYRRIAAVGPECGDWSEDASRVRNNPPYANFGCTAQRNLAHMVANPTDLAFPARETPRGSDRRAVPHKAYTEAPAAPVKLDAR